jgi:hypothetical protein
VLNIGGADVALAQCDVCQNDASGGSTDTCTPPGDPDTCPEGSLPDLDTCSVTPPDPDYCEPVSGGTDECPVVGGDPDICDIGDSIPDACIVDSAVDICEPGPPPPDTCDPDDSDPDYCTPTGLGGGNEDVCPDPSPGDGNVCYFDGMLYDPDICDTTPPYTDEDNCQGEGAPDYCEPGTDPDQPNPVTVSSVGAESASSALPALGGLVAVLGAAALWLRRLRPEKPEEEEST